MSFQTDSKIFSLQNDGCGTQLADGRMVLAPLENCAKVPTIYTLVPAAAAAAAESVTVTITGATASTVVWLDQGRILKFGANEVVVASRTKLTGIAAQAIPVEPLANAILITDTASAISALEVVSVTDMPITFASETENSDVLSAGLQGDMDVTKIRLSSQMSLFVRDDDAAIWEEGFGFSSGTGIVTLYAFISHADDSLALWGPVQFHGFEIANTSASLKKISTTVQFKPTWYRTTKFAFLAPAAKTALNNVRNQFGLAAKV